MRTLWIGCLAGAMALAACADSADTESKPAVDPAEGLLAGDKADGISNYWTTITGELVFGESIKDTITYPDWLHGRTFEVAEGQTVEGLVTAQKAGWTLVYGPATAVVNGQPKFAKAIFSESMGKEGDLFASTFSFTAEEAGTYMVIYGPKYVWTATYKMQVDCVDCEPDEVKCETDSDCGPFESCEHNGVVCVTTPCDVSYSVCEALPTCETDEDCGPDAWCSCTEWGCEGDKQCKNFQLEGEHCGGFTPPQYQEACHPDLSCVYKPFIADAPGTCRNQVTVKELLADPKAWDGVRVYVDGYVEPGLAFCTLMACSVDNPCCNTCGASLQILDQPTPEGEWAEGIGLTEEEEELGCGGNSCEYTEQCDVDPGHYGIVGVFNAATMSLETLERVPFDTPPWENL